MGTLDEALVVGDSCVEGRDDVLWGCPGLCGLWVFIFIYFRGGGRWGKVISIWRRSRGRRAALEDCAEGVHLFGVVR